MALAAVVGMSLGACSLKTAAIRKGDQLAGEKITEAVEAKAPELAAEIRAEAAANEAAGSDTPWLKAIGANWWQIALALGLGGGAAEKIRRLLKERKYARAIMEILSSGFEKFKQAPDAGGPKDLIGAIADARAAHPDAPAGSVRKAMERLGATAARTSPA
jgi:hypothetical protein